jgi:sugar lactone lactonase YvrE
MRASLLCHAAGITFGAGAVFSGQAHASTLANPIFVPYGSSIVEYNTAGSPVATQTTDVAAPEDVAFDTSGNLYWSDYSTSPQGVYEVASAAIPSSSPSFLGQTGSNVSGPSNGPYGLAFDSQHDLYIAGNTTNKVYEFSPTGSFIQTFAVQSTAFGVAIDSSGNMYVTNNAGNVYKFAASGGVPGTSRSSFASGLGTDQGIATDSSGNVFVSSTGSTVNTIYEFNASLAFSQSSFATVDSNGSSYAGLAFDSQGNLFAGGDTTAGGSTNAIWQAGSGGTAITPTIAVTVGNGPIMRMFAIDNAVPEPATIGFFTAVGGAALLRRRRL